MNQGIKSIYAVVPSIKKRISRNEHIFKTMKVHNNYY